jgi:hypothetical protein
MKNKSTGKVTLSQIKVTLDELGEMLGFVVKHMITKEELSEGLLAVQTQINGVESDIREIRHSRLEVRVADLEEKVFGKAR